MKGGAGRLQEGGGVPGVSRPSRSLRSASPVQLQINHTAFGVRVALNVPLRRRERGMAGKLLHVPQGAARLNDLLCTARHERATAASKPAICG